MENAYEEWRENNKKKHEELWLCIETQSRNETQCTIVIQHLHCLLSIRDTRFPFNPHIEMSSFHFLSFVLIKQHHTTASIVQYEPTKNRNLSWQNLWHRQFSHFSFLRQHFAVIVVVVNVTSVRFVGTSIVGVTLYMAFVWKFSHSSHSSPIFSHWHGSRPYERTMSKNGLNWISAFGSVHIFLGSTLLDGYSASNEIFFYCRNRNSVTHKQTVKHTWTGN